MKEKSNLIAKSKENLRIGRSHAIKALKRMSGIRHEKIHSFGIMRKVKDFSVI